MSQFGMSTLCAAPDKMLSSYTLSPARKSSNFRMMINYERSLSCLEKRGRQNSILPNSRAMGFPKFAFIIFEFLPSERNRLLSIPLP
jgi:hypothetical protein